MAYIVGYDRNQINMIMTSLDELIDPENPVRVIDSYVEPLDLLSHSDWQAILPFHVVVEGI